MSKLSKKTLLYAILLFVLYVGAVIIFFCFFANKITINQYSKNIENTFEAIKRMDLDEFSSDEEDDLESLADDYSIIIYSEKEGVIYSDNVWDIDRTVKKRILECDEQYQANPCAENVKKDNQKYMMLRGKVVGNDDIFYVYIRKNTKYVYRYKELMKSSMLSFVILSGIFAAAIFVILYFKVIKPLVRIEDATQKIANNDYVEGVIDEMPKNEIGKIADFVNEMMETTRYSDGKLQNYNYLLSNKNKEIDDFEGFRKKMVGRITHELKTPLAIVSSQVELLTAESDEAKRDHYYTSIMEEIDKMSALISTILQSTKPEPNSVNAKFQWVSISDVFEKLVPKYDNWLKANHIKFNSNIEDGCIAYCNRQQIEQAVNNYMMNAYRHTKPGNEVRLTLKQNQNQYFIGVYNEGVQLPDSELENIWTAFYHMSDKQNDDISEIGLGLYIVKDIMRQHQGECGVHNIDKGTEFYLILSRETQNEDAHIKE